MREIEFRGISVTNGKFVYGDLIHALNGKVYINIKTISGGGTEFIQPIEVIANTVGQYITVKDCKGAKIYTGDIIVPDCYPFVNDGKRNYIAEVCWFENTFAFGYIAHCINKSLNGISSGDGFDFEEDGVYELIGNIHEHKHLLGGEYGNKF